MAGKIYFKILDNSTALQTFAGAQNGKSDRKLYVGNIPDGIDPTTVKSY